MRTTLDIHDDVLEAAKEIARRERVSAGEVVSRLARQALLQPKMLKESGQSDKKRPTGFRPFSSEGARIVTNECIDTLRDQEGL